MKRYNYILLSLLFIVSACDIPEQVNPNNPSLSSILTGATNTDLSNLVIGSLANMREEHNTYVASAGTIPRELYLFDADPRNRTDLVGVGVDQLDNNSFYTTRPWLERYKTIKNLNILLEALEQADESVSDAQKLGYEGFANTLIAHQFLLMILYHGENGIRLDVSDPDNLGPIETETAVYSEIMLLLDNAVAPLNTGEFAFTFTTGFDGFDTPADFLTFNRALAAKTELMRGNYQAALDALPSSFFDLNGDLTVGPKMSYSTSGADILNELFKAPQQSGDQLIVNDNWILDAEPGDLRVANKAAMRDNPTSSSGFNGTHETRLYSSSTDPIDIIRNEELVLIYAEANIGLGGAGLADAVSAIDVIRISAGLNDLATDKPTLDQGSASELLDEMLHQRRYSFWGEGQRMFDLRRYDRLNETYVTLDVLSDPDDNADQQIFQAFPVPLTE